MKWTDCKISHRSASSRTEQGCLSQDIVDITHSEGHQGLEPTQGHIAHRERPVPICLHSVYGCFCSMIAELINCNRDHLTLESPKYLLPGPLLENSANVLEDP